MIQPGTKVIVRDKPYLPEPFAYAGAECVVKPLFMCMEYYENMGNFLSLEVIQAADKTLKGKTIYLHASDVEPV